MKILFLSMDRGLLGDTVGGGVVKRHLYYIQKLEKQTIIVYSPAKYKYKDKIWHENLVIKATGGSNPLSAFKKMYKIGRRILEREEYDLIVTQDPFLTGLVGYKLKKKYDLPLLIDLHGDFFLNKEFIKELYLNRFLLILAKFLIKKATLLRPVNQGIKDKLVKMGMAAEKIEVVPTPVDLDHFLFCDQEKLKELKKRYEKKMILAYIGVIKIEKNLDFFLRVLKKVVGQNYDLKFLLIGEGPKVLELKKLTKDLGLEQQVEFLGGIHHRELPLYYNLIDIFVLPSTSESLGKVIMEAAMAKTAVLASKTLGAQSLITDGETGLLFEINNEEECQKKLELLLNDSLLRQDIGKALFEEIKEKYNYQNNLKKVFECWEKAVSKKNSI